MPNILILTPVLPPAAGGGAAYTMTLARNLIEQGLAHSVVVAAEAFPGQPALALEQGGRLVLQRMFTYRAGRPTRDLRSYVDYARQQLTFLKLGALMRRHEISTVLVHASLLYYPGTLRGVLRHLKRRFGVAVVLDVRDPKIPGHLLERPGEFDAIICCARLLADQLSAYPAYRDRLHFVPIPLEPLTIRPERIEAVLDRHGLAQGGFIFNGTGLSLAKSLDLLVEAVRLLHERGARLPLVVAGRERDGQCEIFRDAIARGELKSVGSLPQDEVLALAAGSALAVHPSAIETPSRMAIEGLMLGARSLLPRNVPEFATSCPHLVCAERPDDLARQMLERLADAGDGGCYDVAAHYPERVVPLYGAVLRRSPASRRAAACVGPRPDPARFGPARFEREETVGAAVKELG